MRPSRAQIYQYMQEVLEEHRDHATDEINETTLAEDAADHFQFYDPNFDEFMPPEYLFHVAFTLAERDKNRRRGTLGSAVGQLIDSNDNCLRG